jgi:hypothetical protein
MTIDPNDFTGLTIVGLTSLTILLAALDTAGSVVAAIIGKRFDSALLLEYLRSHVLLRVFPILALAVLGHGVEQLGVPAVPAADLAAKLSLAAYAIETFASLRGSFTGTQVLSE